MYHIVEALLNATDYFNKQGDCDGLGRSYYLYVYNYVDLGEENSLVTKLKRNTQRYSVGKKNRFA